MRRTPFPQERINAWIPRIHKQGHVVEIVDPLTRIFQRSRFENGTVTPQVRPWGTGRWRCRRG